MAKKISEDDVKGIVGRKAPVTFTSKGFRDVWWCPYGNEPFIIKYKEDGEPTCPNCNDNFEVETHIFICHIDGAKRHIQRKE